MEALRQLEYEGLIEVGERGRLTVRTLTDAEIVDMFAVRAALEVSRLVTLLGVRPEQYPDFAALRGDPSDNLPGVRGFGPRTAARLLTSWNPRVRM